MVERPAGSEVTRVGVAVMRVSPRVYGTRTSASVLAT
jgi:hypothetical protein